MGSVPVAARFVIKRHSQRPSLRMYVKNTITDGPFDFTGATAVKFAMKDSSGNLVFSNPAVIESPSTSGYLRYNWGATDTQTAGEFRAEFDVSYGVGDKLTVPVKGNILVKIYEDVDEN